MYTMYINMYFFMCTYPLLFSMIVVFILLAL